MEVRPSKFWSPHPHPNNINFTKTEILWTRNITLGANCFSPHEKSLTELAWEQVAFPPSPAPHLQGRGRIPESNV